MRFPGFKKDKTTRDMTAMARDIINQAVVIRDAAVWNTARDGKTCPAAASLSGGELTWEKGGLSPATNHHQSLRRAQIERQTLEALRSTERLLAQIPALSCVDDIGFNDDGHGRLSLRIAGHNAVDKKYDLLAATHALANFLEPYAQLVWDQNTTCTAHLVVKRTNFNMRGPQGPKGMMGDLALAKVTAQFAVSLDNAALVLAPDPQDALVHWIAGRYQVTPDSDDYTRLAKAFVILPVHAGADIAA